MSVDPKRRNHQVQWACRQRVLDALLDEGARGNGALRMVEHVGARVDADQSGARMTCHEVLGGDSGARSEVKDRVCLHVGWWYPQLGLAGRRRTGSLSGPSPGRCQRRDATAWSRVEAYASRCP